MLKKAKLKAETKQGPLAPVLGGSPLLNLARPVFVRCILRFLDWKDRRQFGVVSKQANVVWTLEAFEQPLTLDVSQILGGYLQNVPNGIKVKELCHYISHEDPSEQEMEDEALLLEKIDTSSLKSVIARNGLSNVFEEAIEGWVSITSLTIPANYHQTHIIQELPNLTELELHGSEDFRLGKELDSTSLTKLNWYTAYGRPCAPSKVHLPNLKCLSIGSSSYSPIYAQEYLGRFLEPSVLPRLEQLELHQVIHWTPELSTWVHRLPKVKIHLHCKSDEPDWWEEDMTDRFFALSKASKIQHLQFYIFEWHNYWNLDEFVQLLWKFPLLGRVDFELENSGLFPADLVILLEHHSKKHSKKHSRTMEFKAWQIGDD
jgi:hypothetical protein